MPSDLLALAAECGDLPLLTAQLAAQPDPDRVVPLTKHADPAVVAAALDHARPRAAVDPALWRAALPPTVAGLPPRVQVLAAQLARALVGCEGVAWPETDGLDDPEAQAWWAAVQMAREGVLPADRGVLWRTLALIRVAEVQRPLRLVDALPREPEFDQTRARLLVGFGEAGLASPTTLARRLAALLQSPDPRARSWAGSGLCAGWARLGAAPRGLKAALAAGFDVVRVAVAWGEAEGLRATFEAGALPGALRADALAGIGEVGDRPALDAAIGCAVTDPLLFGAALATCLDAFHRRGIFARDPQVGPLLTVFEQTPAWTPQAFARVTYTARAAVLAGVGANPTPRTVALLPHLRGDVAGVAAACLVDAATPTTTALLVAIGAAELDALEPAVLAHLALGGPGHTRAALGALRRIGGAATVATVHAALRPPLADWARHTLDETISLAWHLDEPGTLALLSGSPALRAWLPEALQIRLAAQRQPAAQALLDEALPRATEATPWIKALAERGLAADVPTIGRLLVRHVRAQVEAGQDAEPRLDSGVRAAVIALGRRLHEAGAIRPRALLRGSDAGWSLLADLLAAQLPDPSPRVETLVLTELTELEAPWLVEAVQPYLRASTPSVRRQAIRWLARHEAQGLAWNIAHLVTADDAPTARAALEATGAFNPSASTALVAGLGHRNMNVRRTAARLLAAHPAPAAVPALVGWLERHDAAGFRWDLLAALDATLDCAATNRLLVDRLLVAEPEPARRLVAALSVRLDRAAQRWLPDHPALAPIRAAWSARPKPPPSEAGLDRGLRDDAVLRDTPARALRLMREAEPAEADAALLRFVELGPALDLRWVRPNLAWLIDQVPCRVDARPAGAAARLVAEGVRWFRALPVADQVAWAVRIRARASCWPEARARWLGAVNATVTSADVRACRADCAAAPDPAAALRRTQTVLFPGLEVGAPWPDETPARARWQHAAEVAERIEQGRKRAARAVDEAPSAQREARLIAALEGPDAVTAASTLLAWPASAGPRAVAQRWLAGGLRDLRPSTALAAAVAAEDWADAEPERVLACASWYSNAAIERHTPTLLRWAAAGAPRARDLLGEVSPEWLLTCGAAWMPQSARLVASARAEATIAALGAAEPVAARVQQAISPRAAVDPEAVAADLPELTPEPKLEDWLALAGDANPAAVRRALRALRHHPGAPATACATRCMDHRDRGVRAAALRCLRDVAPRAQYLAAVRSQLDAGNLGVRRAAVRAVGYARDADSARTLLGMLNDPDRQLRDEVGEALVRIGEPAIPELHRALRRARPDRRARLEALLVQIEG